MKTALYLPGHIRGFKETYDSLYFSIIGPNDCDIYISTSTALTKVYEERIETVYMDKDELEKEIRSVYGERLKGLIIEEESKEDVQASISDDNPNRSKQWLRLKQCHEMAKNSGIRYYFAVRTRTDLKYPKKKLTWSSRSTKFLYSISHVDPGIAKFYDFFAIGSFIIMDKYLGRIFGSIAI